METGDIDLMERFPPRFACDHGVIADTWRPECGATRRSAASSDRRLSRREGLTLLAARGLAAVPLLSVGTGAACPSAAGAAEPPIPREPKPAKFNKKLRINDRAPSFADLAAADGRRYSLGDFSEAAILVIVFLSRKCPVSREYQTRFTELCAEFEPHGLQMVGISVATGANEQLDKVREELKVHPRPYPWLHDPTQKVGRDYGAYVTPQLFVLDSERRVVYMGAFDDHHDRKEVVKHYVLDAVDAIIRNRPVLVPESLPKGCEIEYAGEERPAEE